MRHKIAREEIRERASVRLCTHVVARRLDIFAVEFLYLLLLLVEQLVDVLWRDGGSVCCLGAVFTARGLCQRLTLPRMSFRTHIQCQICTRAISAVAASSIMLLTGTQPRPATQLPTYSSSA